jgi:uncharacterized protein
MGVNAPTPIDYAAPPRKRRLTRGWWLKQLHTWHWTSAAVSLAGMFGFALTGVTLNHGELVPAKPVVVDRSATLPASLMHLLRTAPQAANAPVPAAVAEAVEQLAGLDPSGRVAEWSDDEVYVAMPRAGGDAWVSINRESGEIKAETTDQGVIALLNDLHKGRNTGLAWRLFIDVFAAAAMIFTVTGLVLLHWHAKHRRKTWPLVGLGIAVPLVLFIAFIH